MMLGLMVAEKNLDRATDRQTVHVLNVNSMVDDKAVKRMEMRSVLSVRCEMNK